MIDPVGICNGCGEYEPEYLDECPYCGAEVCEKCESGDDVPCTNCPSECDDPYFVEGEE